MSTTPEYSRPVRIDTLSVVPHAMAIEADQSERQALAKRFNLLGIDRLTAEIALTRAGDAVKASGTLAAKVTQRCVATDAPVAASVDERFDIVFRPQPATPGAEDEIELSDAEMDVVFYDGAAIDIGEAVAETLSLSLDPYPRAPDAEAILRAAGVKQEGEAGGAAFAGLKGLLKP
ncbi:MAG: DUF177 domain-containing protein [Pseudomonadota bacterium]|nr:DUF177 domain-containing protein [Pseudomonadota bacterium]